MRLPSVLFVLLSACGGSQTEVCPSERHLADPDGHGARCIDDESTCDAPSDCASSDACCDALCADEAGSGVFSCSQDCRQPDCTDGSCGPGFVCRAGLDECSADCVPDDLDCPAGTIPADPRGTGQFVCVREDSECLSAASCGADPGGCCTPVCQDAGDSRYVCQLSCLGEEREEREEGAEAWECSSNEDCDRTMGGVGFTCVMDPCAGNWCQEPAGCVTADDCVWALDTSACCSCPQPVPRSVVGQGCWVELADAFAGAPDPEGDQEGKDIDECSQCGGVDCTQDWMCQDTVPLECTAGLCQPAPL